MSDSGSSLKLAIGSNSEPINIVTYKDLCDNFIFLDGDEASRYRDNKVITFKQLRSISRKNGLSYPLFFASRDRVRRLIDEYNSKLYGKIDERSVLILGSRDNKVDIRRIRWIIADISEKQKIYKKYGSDTNLQTEKIVKFLKKSKKGVREQANYILYKTRISIDEVQGIEGKNKALKYLESKLSEVQIHVYREARNAMPQNLPDDFLVSGVYIRDNYNPVIFIGNELSLYPDEGVGRKIYTLIFLLVSLFKDYSFAIQIMHGNPTMDSATKNKLSEIHAITNEILMPEDYLKSLTLNDLASIKSEASKLKVSPTALAVRIAMLGFIKKDIADDIKQKLTDEYSAYIASKKAEDKKKRDAGQNTGPPLRNLCKSYQGDFIEFVKNNVPENEKRRIFDSRISYGRSYIRYEDLYG